jgi:uncharacterized membrane protein YvbJ
MKMLLVILLIFSFIFPKEYCYSEEEVTEIHDIINECDFKEQVHLKVEENLSAQIKNCELNVDKHKLLISELEKQLELKDDLIKEVKPKWHENKYLWFGYGILAIILPTWVLGNVN